MKRTIKIVKIDNPYNSHICWKDPIMGLLDDPDITLHVAKPNSPEALIAILHELGHVQSEYRISAKFNLLRAFWQFRDLTKDTPTTAYNYFKVEIDAWMYVLRCTKNHYHQELIKLIYEQLHDQYSEVHFSKATIKRLDKLLAYRLSKEFGYADIFAIS